ncbi:MAG: beta-propeller fold lactonase family protein [Gammaproteobacteria bacterium]|nr:beta-propeller fold lactonase family protein [Gammaproteobacteria bacterium]
MSLLARFSTFALVVFTTSGVMAAPTVYVPLGSANEITIIDAATGEKVGAIGGLVNPHGLAVTADGKLLVVGSNQERVAAQGKVPPKPEGMSEAEHLSHHKMPATGAASSIGLSHIDIIDVLSKKRLQRVEVKGAVHHNLVTPDGRYGISTHTSTGSISVIDLKTYKLIKTVSTGPMPNYAVISGDGKHIYVSNVGNGTISEIDTATWIVTRNLIAGKAPEHLAISPDGSKLYVNNVGDGTVAVIALKTGKVTQIYSVGKSPHGISLSDDGKTLFVASKAGNKLVTLDLATGEQQSVSLSPAPYHVTTIRGTGKLYVSSRKLPKIWVVDQKTLAVLGEIKTKGFGHQMAVVD